MTDQREQITEDPNASPPAGADEVAVRAHRPVDRAEAEPDGAGAAPAELTATERELLADLFAIVEEHADEVAQPVDRRQVVEAFVFACEHHADQRRKSGEDFIVHPVGVAKICAGHAARHRDAVRRAAARHRRGHDARSLDEVRSAFGEEVAGLVDGVTKLTGITFQSRDEAQAENYRKMMVAMATDIRVILIKLADRLHNMRTLGAMPKQKQIEKAQGDAGDLRAARAPARHPRDQVGARGPRLRDAAPAQVPGDQGPGQPAARRARALRGQGGRLPGARSSRRSASTPRSPAARSTSTRSTRR